jgi:hypothetical protein
MRTSLALISASVALAVALGPATAGAMPLFPPTIQSDLCLSYQPPCTICHVGAPGLGTATTGFAEAMIANGLNFGDVGSVAPALAALAGTDAGVSYIVALEAGLDPNTGATIGTSTAGALLGDGGCAAGPPLQPVYGCGAQMAPAPAPSGTALVVAASLVVSVVRAASRTSSRKRLPRDGAQHGPRLS